MMIAELLVPERVQANLRGRTKDEVLDELAALLADPEAGRSQEKVAAVLRERERLNSTAIGGGVAIPHGRMAGVSTITLGFARSAAGVDFDSVDQAPTHIFFALLAPDDAAAQHLKALARISRVLKDEHFRERLKHLETHQELCDAILEEDARV